MVCPAHPDREAVSACAVCGRPVCDLCVGGIDDLDFCPVHFEIEERRIQSRAYGLPPLPAPVTIPELLIGVWAVVGAFAPWVAWYRTIVLDGSRIVDAVEESGWEAGGIAALASLSLLSTGLLLGFMVGIRLIRARLLRPEPVVAAAVAIAPVTLGLLAIRILTRFENLYAGLYLAVASAVTILVLAVRMRRRMHSP